MPQFDTTYLISQIFWLMISFFGLYLGIRFIVFPMFDSIFKAREELIQKPIIKAEKLMQDAQRFQEVLKQKQEMLIAKNNKKLHEAQMTAHQKMQVILEKEKKDQAVSLKRSLSKLECDEKQILKGSDAFVVKALKGQM